MQVWRLPTSSSYHLLPASLIYSRRCSLPTKGSFRRSILTLCSTSTLPAARTGRIAPLLQTLKTTSRVFFLAQTSPTVTSVASSSSPAHSLRSVVLAVSRRTHHSTHFLSSQPHVPARCRPFTLPTATDVRVLTDCSLSSCPSFLLLHPRRLVCTGSAVKLRSTSVPEHVRAVVGRVCAADERGVVADFVVSSIGTGVWFGKGGVVLTAYHVVEDLPDLSRIYFYLFNPGTGQWVRKLMEVAAYHDSWDIAVLQQVRSASRQRDGDSDYEPQVLDTLWAQPDADAWSIAFPQIIDTTLAPTARSSSTSVSASTSYASSSSSSSTLAPSAFAPSSSSVSVSLSLLSSSSSSASSTASSFSLTLSSPLLTSESSSTPASSSSSSSSSSSTSSFAFSSPTLSAPSTSTSVSSSVPASSAVDWQPQSPVITKGIISKIGFQHLIHVADYIAAPNSSGGAVVGQSEQGAWYLIGIHVGVVHHDIDRTQTVEEQVTQASGTSPFAEFIAIQSIQSWYEKALPPNCQVFNSSSNRKVERIVGEKRKRGSATGQSAAVVAPAAVDEGGEGGGEGDDELVYEVKEGWVGYYDRRLNPVPLPARPRAQSEPSPSHAAAVRAAGGGTTGSRGAQSL